MHPQPEGGLTADEIRALQEQAWAETFRWVMARSRFYQEHLRRAGFSAVDRPTLAALQRIPPIDKDRLSREVESFLCVPRREVAEWVTTSGSTGEPLNYPMSARDLERLGANEELSFRCAGLTGDETVLLAVTMDRCFIAGLAYYLGLRRLGCAVVRGGPATPALHLNLLRWMRPEVIVGVPSFLCRIADTAAAEGRPLHGASVRKAVCIGEPIREPDGTLNPVGMRIATEWRAEVYSTYGMTELACSLCECPAGQGGHLHPALLYLEALDDDGQPVSEGEVGELTATTFAVEALPLVRYRTGDCAALHLGRCPCGQETPRIGPIVGRKGQKMKLKGTTIFPSTLARVLDTAEGVTTYVVVAQRGTDLSDRVEVRVACAGDPTQVLARLRERFRGEARVTPELSAASAESIEALRLPEGARKRRYFVDLRSCAQ